MIFIGTRFCNLHRDVETEFCVFSLSELLHSLASLRAPQRSHKRTRKDVVVEFYYIHPKAHELGQPLLYVTPLKRKDGCTPGADKLYCSPPPGFSLEPGKGWKMLKGLYGAHQSVEKK